MMFMRKALAITWKDAMLELRTREIVFSVLVFAFLAIVTFNFAFGANQEAMGMVAPGILWVTFAFSGILSLNRAFLSEKDENCLEGLMACPTSREAIYIAKVLGSLLFMLIVEAIALPGFVFLLNLTLSLQLVVITLLTTVGFVGVGTLFSALAVNTRAREMVLPILFLPIIVPLIVCAVKASGLALTGSTWAGLLSWLKIIGAFDVIFLVVSYLVFSFVIEE